MSSTTLGLGFWLTFVVPLVVVLLLAYAVYRSWRTLPAARSLHWQAIDYPIQTGITAAGVVIPLLIGLISYSLNNGYSLSRLRLIVISVMFFAISIVVGLYTTFSVATLADDKNVVPISGTSNTVLPSLLFTEFALFFLGISFAVAHLFYGLPAHPPTPVYSVATEEVLRPPLSLGLSLAEVRAAWGDAPATQAADTTELKYAGKGIEYLVVLHDDHVTEVIKRKILAENKASNP